MGNVVKCNLNTGVWNAALPTCEAERLVVSVGANQDAAAAPTKKPVKATKPPKKKKMVETDNRTNDFDFNLPDFTEPCGPRGNSKCEKREMRKFCALHPTNFFC